MEERELYLAIEKADGAIALTIWPLCVQHGSSIVRRQGTDAEIKRTIAKLEANWQQRHPEWVPIKSWRRISKEEADEISRGLRSKEVQAS